MRGQKKQKYELVPTAEIYKSDRCLASCLFAESNFLSINPTVKPLKKSVLSIFLLSTSDMTSVLSLTREKLCSFKQKSIQVPYFEPSPNL